MNAFEIVIYAIVALALIAVFYLVANQFFTPQTNTDAIKQLLRVAQTDEQLGKTVSPGQLNYVKDNSIFITALQDKDTTVSFECTSSTDCCTRQRDAKPGEKCDKAVAWDSSFITVKENKKIYTGARCVDIKGYPVCTVYISGKPAQAQIQKLEVLDTSQGTGEIKETVTNTGPIPLAGGLSSVKVYKKSDTGWVETDYNAGTKEIDSVLPGQTQFFLWTISPTNSGDYKAEVTFEGQNAGFDKKDVNFSLDTSLSCKTDDSRQSDTIFDPETQTYQELHYCTGCTYAYQCAAAWSSRTGTDFNSGTADAAYCTKNTVSGAC